MACVPINFKLLNHIVMSFLFSFLYNNLSNSYVYVLCLLYILLSIDLFFALYIYSFEGRDDVS